MGIRARGPSPFVTHRQPGWVSVPPNTPQSNSTELRLARTRCGSSLATAMPAQDISTGRMAVICASNLAPLSQYDLRMTPGESLRDAIAGGMELTACEAVAIAQQLITSTDGDGGQPVPSGELSLDDLRLNADGSVTCGARTGRAGVSEIGMLLAEMLPAEATTRVPGALRYTIARARSQVDAPPFESVAQLSAALARYEQGDRTRLLRDLYDRAASRPPAHAAIDVDRRQRTPSASTLRRQLREADEALFVHLHRTAGTLQGAQPAPPPPAAVGDLFAGTVATPSAARVGGKFGGTNWVLGSALALSIAFGAGYAVVAGTRHANNMERPPASALTPEPASTAAAASDGRQSSRPDAMPEPAAARRSGGSESARARPTPRQ